MAKVKSFTIKGTAQPDFTLPKEFSEKINASLIAQALHVFEARGHTGFSKVKTRAEVNRTKKKLYKQKGTGGARHGSRRAPIFVGGGVAHGPKLEERILTLPRKLRIAGRNSVLSLKASLGDIVVIGGLEKIVKTKEALPILKVFGNKKLTFLLSEKSVKAKKSLNNLKNVNIIFYKDASALDLFRGGTLVIDKNLFEAKKAETKTKTVEKKVRKVVKK